MNHIREAWARRVRADSWRPFNTPDTEMFWKDYDAVISVSHLGAGRRGNTYEIYTYGRQIASRGSLEEAKAVVEEVYGPLSWRRLQMPLQEIEHYYFGPSTEWSDPTTLYVVEHLPKLLPEMG